MNKALQNAATELAERKHRQHIPSAITTEDALPFVDERLVEDWLTEECAAQPAGYVWTDIFDGLTDADCRKVLFLLLRDTDLPRYTLASHLRQFVASEIAREAERVYDDMDSAQDEIWDDPVRADRRAIAAGRGAW